jgi:hypothetical protein
MKPIIIKQQLSIAPKWTDNIKDEWINPLILQTCEYKFFDTISSSLYNAMAASVGAILDGTQGLQWDVATAYSGGDIVIDNGVYYVALQSVTGGNPPATNADWQVYEIINFWANFVVPYLALSAYCEFLIWGGKHIAMGGLRRHLDNTSTEIGADDLAVLLGSVRSMIGVKLTKLNNELLRTNYTFDGVKYDANIVKPGNKIKIYAV